MCVHILEMQTAAAKEKLKELEVCAELTDSFPKPSSPSLPSSSLVTLQDQIHQQPMSAKDARELRQSISDAEHMLEKHRQIQQQNMDRVEELQMQHNR